MSLGVPVVNEISRPWVEFNYTSELLIREDLIFEVEFELSFTWVIWAGRGWWFFGTATFFFAWFRRRWRRGGGRWWTWGGWWFLDVLILWHVVMVFWLNWLSLNHQLHHSELLVLYLPLLNHLLSELTWIVTCMAIMLRNYNLCVSLAICHDFWTTLTLMPMPVHVPMPVAVTVSLARCKFLLLDVARAERIMELLKMVSSMNTKERPSFTFRLMVAGMVADNFIFLFYVSFKVWMIVRSLSIYCVGVYNDVVFIVMMVVLVPKLIFSNIEFFELRS